MGIKNLRVKILLVLSLMFSMLILGQTTENDSILLWQSDRLLKWKDFKGSSIKSITNKIAETQGMIIITDVSWDKNIPKYNIKSFFSKYDSWTTVNDSATLKHEQVHFDILELYTRKARKAFDSLNCIQQTDLKVYEEIYYQCIESSNQVNSKYDSEVYFNEEKQRYWEQFISKELKRLCKYEYPR